MATGRDRFYFPPPEVVDSTPVDKAATIADALALYTDVDNLQDQINTNSAAIANLEEVGAASSTTPAYVADIQDMATVPRSQLVSMSVAASGSLTTGSAGNGSTSSVTVSTLGSSHSHTGPAHTHPIVSHSHDTSIVMPKYKPDNYANILGQYVSKVDYTPIVVDRAGVVKKLRWIVGNDDSIFSINAYYMALCVYNPSNGNIEKVWDSGDIKSGAANTTNLQETEIDMGIDQHCTPGQILFVAHQQIAGDILMSTTRSFAAVPQAGIGRPSTLLLDACSYQTSSRVGSIPSSVALSSLTRINTRIPWAAVSVDTSEGA